MRCSLFGLDKRVKAAGEGRGVFFPAYFAAFIIYASSCVTAEILFLLTAMPYIYDVVISVACGSILFFCLWRSHHLSFPVWTRWDVVVAAVFCVAFLIQCWFPEAEPDTANYHLIHQTPFLMSQVAESFFPSSSLHTFLLPLGDRMFFLFRYAMGMRMGTVLNVLIALLLYFQVKEIMMRAVQDFAQRNAAAASLFSFSAIAIVIRSTVAFPTYYIDRLALPIVLYFAWRFLSDERMSLKELVFSAYLFGLAFSLKMNAGGMALLFFVFFVWHSRKNMDVKGFAYGVLAACIPILPFLVAPYQQTGSPFFPFFGQLFPSPYFPHPEDSRLVFGVWLNAGPQGMLQHIFYPVYTLLGKIRASFPLMVLFLISFATMVVFWWQKRSVRTDVRLMAVYLVSYVFLLALCHGDYRYDCLFLVWIPVILLRICHQLATSTRKGKFFAYGLSILLLVYTMRTLAIAFFWCDAPKMQAEGRSIPFYQEHWAAARANYAKLFHDRSTGISEEEVSDVRAWLSLPDLQPSASYEFLLKPSAPILSADGYVPLWGDSERYRGSFGEEKYLELLAPYEENGLYAILALNARGGERATAFGNVFQHILKNHGMKVISLQTLHPDFIAAHQSIQMAGVRKAEASCTFQEIVADRAPIILGTCKAGERKQLDAFVGYRPELVGTVPRERFSATVVVRAAGIGDILYSEMIQAEEAFAPVSMLVDGGDGGCEVLLVPDEGNAAYGTLALCYWEEATE